MPQKFLTKKNLKDLPPLYETDGTPADEKTVQVKFFNPAGGETWYAVEFDGSNIFFGYVDGTYFPEWGYFSMAELQDVRISVDLLDLENGTIHTLDGLRIERDIHFTPTRFGDLMNQRKTCIECEGPREGDALVCKTCTERMREEDHETEVAYDEFLAQREKEAEDAYYHKDEQDWLRDQYYQDLPGYR
jgi:hypothetical protein